MQQARELEKTAASKGVEIILPTDVVVADAFSADANTQVLLLYIHSEIHRPVGVGAALCFVYVAPVLMTGAP